MWRVSQETGIIIHSIIIGIAYGAETDYGVIRALTVALGFHQVCSAVSPAFHHLYLSIRSFCSGLVPAFQVRAL